MINTVIGWVASLTVGKQLVGAVAWAHNRLDGNKSEIALGILALVHVLKLTGTIPAATADGIEKALGAILPLTLADRASKVLAIADKIIPAATADEVKPA